MDPGKRAFRALHLTGVARIVEQFEGSNRLKPWLMHVKQAWIACLGVRGSPLEAIFAVGPVKWRAQRAFIRSVLRRCLHRTDAGCRPHLGEIRSDAEIVVNSATSLLETVAGVGNDAAPQARHGFRPWCDSNSSTSVP